MGQRESSTDSSSGSKRKTGGEEEFAAGSNSSLKKARLDNTTGLNSMDASAADPRALLLQAYADAFGRDSFISFIPSGSISEGRLLYGCTALLQPASLLRHVYAVEDIYISADAAKSAVCRLVVKHDAIKTLQTAMESLPISLRSTPSLPSSTISTPEIPRGSPPSDNSREPSAQPSASSSTVNPIGAINDAVQKHGGNVPVPIYDFVDNGRTLLCKLTIALPDQSLAFQEVQPYDLNKPSTKRMKETVARKAIDQGVLDLLKPALIRPIIPQASTSTLPSNSRSTSSAPSHAFDHVPNPVSVIVEALQAVGRSPVSVIYTHTDENVLKTKMFGCKLDLEGTRYTQEPICRSKKEAKELVSRKALNEGLLDLIRPKQPSTSSSYYIPTAPLPSRFSAPPPSRSNENSPSPGGLIGHTTLTKSISAQQAWMALPSEPSPNLPIQSHSAVAPSPSASSSTSSLTSLIPQIETEVVKSEKVKELEQVCLVQLGDAKALSYDIRPDPRNALFGCVATLTLARNSTRQYRTQMEYHSAADALDGAARIALDRGVVKKIEEFLVKQKAEKEKEAQVKTEEDIL